MANNTGNSRRPELEPARGMDSELSRLPRLSSRPSERGASRSERWRAQREAIVPENTGQKELASGDPSLSP